MKNSPDTGYKRWAYLTLFTAAVVIYLFPGGFFVSALGRTAFFSKSKEGVFLRSLVPHLLMLLSLSIIVRKVFSRSVLSYMNFTSRKFLSAALVTLLTFAAVSLIHPGTVVFNSGDTLSEKLLFLSIILLLIPLQTLSEEFLYRVIPEKVYSPDGNMNRRDRIILALLSGILFTLPHLLNREVRESSSPFIPVVSYFLFGFLSSFFSTYSEEYTSVWGVHTANNIYALCVVGSKKSGLETSPFFYDVSNEYSPLLPFSYITVFLLLYILEKTRRKKCNSKK